MVIHSFKKCGLSNSLDGSENGLVHIEGVPEYQFKMPGDNSEDSDQDSDSDSNSDSDSDSDSDSSSDSDSDLDSDTDSDSDSDANSDDEVIELMDWTNDCNDLLTETEGTA